MPRGKPSASFGMSRVPVVADGTGRSRFTGAAHDATHRLGEAHAIVGQSENPVRPDLRMAPGEIV